MTDIKQTIGNYEKWKSVCRNVPAADLLWFLGVKKLKSDENWRIMENGKVSIEMSSSPAADLL